MGKNENWMFLNKKVHRWLKINGLQLPKSKMYVKNLTVRSWEVPERPEFVPKSYLLKRTKSQEISSNMPEKVTIRIEKCKARAARMQRKAQKNVELSHLCAM